MWISFWQPSRRSQTAGLRSVRPLDEKEARAVLNVLNDKILSKRVMRSRACYRDKNCGQGEVKAKCRVVCLGHQDPDLHSISRQSPTPGRTTEMILYAMLVGTRSFLTPTCFGTAGQEMPPQHSWRGARRTPRDLFPSSCGVARTASSSRHLAGFTIFIRSWATSTGCQMLQTCGPCPDSRPRAMAGMTSTR